MDMSVNRILESARSPLHGLQPGFDAAAAIERARAAAARDEAREVAQQFETMLVQELVSSFRESTSIGGGGMFGEGPGSEQYGAMFDQNLAEAVTRGGHVGIADRLMSDFERWRQIPTAAEAGEAGEHVDPARVDLSGYRNGARPRGGIDAHA